MNRRTRESSKLLSANFKTLSKRKCHTWNPLNPPRLLAREPPTRMTAENMRHTLSLPIGVVTTLRREIIIYVYFRVDDSPGSGSLLFLRASEWGSGELSTPK